METSDKKQYILIKTTPNDVLFTLHSVDNPQITRQIFLTKKHPRQPLPKDWALGVIADQTLYSMFKQGYFTFDDPAALAKVAYEAGYWFDEKWDFTPSSPEDENLIFSILKVGNRTKIEETIKKYGMDKVKDVAITHADELTQNVISVLEKLFGVQLTIDGVADLETAAE